MWLVTIALATQGLAQQRSVDKGPLLAFSVIERDGGRRQDVLRSWMTNTSFAQRPEATQHVVGPQSELATGDPIIPPV